jgi:hypothetical protein
MSQIFLSHSSHNNDYAVALRDWLAEQGWDDVFLDTDPRRGITAGERWEAALHKAAQRCEAVLFLVSEAWLASGWCLKEFHLAHRLNKRLFGVLIEDLPIARLPAELTGTWQLVPLVSGRSHSTNCGAADDASRGFWRCDSTAPQAQKHFLRVLPILPDSSTLICRCVMVYSHAFALGFAHWFKSRGRLGVV